MSFDVMQYTQDALARELYLVELHAKDGSAVEGGCACIEEKHLLGIEGLAQEGANISTKEKEKKFYAELAALSRNLRKAILEETFSLPYSNPIHWTKCELAHPTVQKKIEKCVLRVKGKPHVINPYAVCRASIKCPP